MRISSDLKQFKGNQERDQWLKRIVIRILLTVPLFTASLVQAQQLKRIPTVGYLTASSPDLQRHLIQAFKQGLLDLGYVEGQNFALETRAAAGKYDLLPALARELVELKPNVIFAASAPAIGAAKEAAGNIPIVSETLSDSVADGFVATLAKPGGNLTGLAGLAPELSGKRLELLPGNYPRTHSRKSLLMREVSCLMGRTSKICFACPPITLTRSSKEPNLPTCRYSNQPSLSSSST